MPGDVETMLDMMDRILGLRPAWYIEHIIDRSVQTWSEMTSQQVQAVVEALDIASEVACEHDIEDVASWLDRSEQDGYDLTDLASLEEAAKAHIEVTSSAPDEPAQRPDDWYRAQIRACRSRFEQRDKDQYRDITLAMADFISDWPDEWVEEAKYMMLPFRAVAEIRDHWGEEGACEAVEEWIDANTDGWPEEEARAVVEAYTAELEHLRDNDITSVMDSIASGKGAITPKADGEQADAFGPPDHRDDG